MMHWLHRRLRRTFTTVAIPMTVVMTRILPLRQPVSCSRLVVLMLVWLMAIGASLAPAQAATPAGTLIRNQASASYVDEAGTRVSVTSNLVETRIEQVAGLALVADQQLRAVAGGTVRFTHRVRNTGNGDDRFALQLINAGGDDINLSGLNLYADTDRNGLRDSDTPITTTDWMAADAEFYVVIEGTVPGSASVGDVAILTITATSDFDTGVSDSNSDTTTVDDGATLSLIKSISRTQGLSPSGPYTVRLQYENTGVATATEVTIIDALPSGMTYVAGSGRWSGSAAILSDANPLDTHSGSVSSVRYCAYDASCTGLAEALSDTDSDSSNQVTLIIDTLAAGDVGALTFEVEIASDLPSGVLINQAEHEFISNASTSPRGLSNPVGYTVLPTAGVVANGSVATDIDGMSEPVSVISAAEGGVIRFDNIIWNTGNTTDTFNIELQSATSTFPPGSVFTLLRGDGATPLQDTNNDGLRDTGPVSAGASATVVLRVRLPNDVSGNNGGVGFDLVKRARSVRDASVTNTVTDHLDEIIANQVDLTNQAPAGSPGALGSGPGPEVLPVSSLSPGVDGVARVDLYLRHQGVVSDTYTLSAFGTAAGAPLPEGWTVRFVDPVDGLPMVDSGPLGSGESVHLVAEVMVPQNALPGTTSLYFEARSARTGASDMKHDAIVITSDNGLNLQPSLSAQVEAGGTVQYRHTLSNIGNVSITDVDLQLSHSLTDWTASLFLDVDQNGELDDTDPMLDSALTLLPGEFADVFVKVFAPANALQLDRNISTLTATWNGGADTVQITDTTTVTRTHVSIRKEQAVDMGCDGAPDAGSSFSQARLEVPPGNNCVMYRLTAINTGLETSFNVKISDNTPSFTRYRTAAACTRVPCWVTEPANEGTGPISAETDQLASGDSFSLTFSVRIE